MIEGLKLVHKEHRDNLYRIWVMAKASMQKQTVRTSLGLWWIVIRDIVYFVVFCVFRFLISGNKEIEGIHFIVYLVLGLGPWFIMNEILSGATSSIMNGAAIIQSISFPITIIPTVETIAVFMKRAVTIVFMFIVTIAFKSMHFNILLFLYYYVSLFLLMLGFCWVLSALVAISSDFRELLLAILRVLMFSMPVIWSFEMLVNAPWAVTLLKANPMVYIIMGFKDAFVLGNMPELGYTIYFWIVTIASLVIGAYIQFKLRKIYADVI